MSLAWNKMASKSANDPRSLRSLVTKQLAWGQPAEMKGSWPKPNLQSVKWKYLLKYKIFLEELKLNFCCCSRDFERTSGGLREISISSSGIGLVDTTVSRELRSPGVVMRHLVNTHTRIQSMGSRRILFLLLCIWYFCPVFMVILL